MVLDRAVALQLPEYIEYGVKCLTASVLSILLTAPMGAILMSTLGPRWLDKKDMGGGYEEDLPMRRSMYADDLPGEQMRAQGVRHRKRQQSREY